MASEKQVYFVRHGQSEANLDGIARGDASRLTRTGRDQARIVAKRIHKLDVEALVVSPFVRTRATAEAIADRTGLVIEISDLFAERRSTSLRLGRSLDDPAVREMEQAIFDGYATPGYRHSDEETFEELKHRALAALDYLAHHEKPRICVVTHGVFLRVLLATATYGTALAGRDMQKFIHSFETSNTGIFSFRYSVNPWDKTTTPGMEWRIDSWNDLAHFG